MFVLAHTRWESEFWAKLANGESWKVWAEEVAAEEKLQRGKLGNKWKQNAARCHWHAANRERQLQSQKKNARSAQATQNGIVKATGRMFYYVRPSAKTWKQKHVKSWGGDKMPILKQWMQTLKLIVKSKRKRQKSNANVNIQRMTILSQAEKLN